MQIRVVFLSTSGSFCWSYCQVITWSSSHYMSQCYTCSKLWQKCLLTDVSQPTTWNLHGALNLLQNLIWSTYCKTKKNKKNERSLWSAEYVVESEPSLNGKWDQYRIMKNHLKINIWDTFSLGIFFFAQPSQIIGYFGQISSWA